MVIIDFDLAGGCRLSAGCPILARGRTALVHVHVARAAVFMAGGATRHRAAVVILLDVVTPATAAIRKALVAAAAESVERGSATRFGIALGALWVRARFAARVYAGSSVLARL